MQNYYEILEVNKCASEEVIEKVYKIFIKKYHPDLYQDSKKAEMEEKMKLYNEAYEVLSDKNKREKYDRDLEEEEKKKYEGKNSDTNASNYSSKNASSYAKEKSTNYTNNTEGFGKEDLVINQLNRFENILSRYEQMSNINSNVGTNNQKYNEEEDKVSDFELFKYKVRRVFMIIGIIAVTMILLYIIPFTRGLINALFTAIGSMVSKI